MRSGKSTKKPPTMLGTKIGNGLVFILPMYKIGRRKAISTGGIIIGLVIGLVPSSYSRLRFGGRACPTRHYWTELASWRQGEGRFDWRLPERTRDRKGATPAHPMIRARIGRPALRPHAFPHSPAPGAKGRPHRSVDRTRTFAAGYTLALGADRNPIGT